MRYLAVLGRQPEISIAELESVIGSCAGDSTGPVVASSPTSQSSVGAPQAPPPVDVPGASPARIYMFAFDGAIEIEKLGGVIKLAVELPAKPVEYLLGLPEGKVTIGVSDYAKGASRKTAATEALKFKRVLVKNGRSVRVIENKNAVLSSATSLHNGLSGKNPRKVELIRTDEGWFRVIGVQDIDAYARRDQARPARDAKVGMLPPKLAQILINLCGPLKPGAVVLDPFCGTGVVLQEAALMGYIPYGTDVNPRMVEYARRNLGWLIRDNDFTIEQGDATSYTWKQPIDAVVCEGYLGRPMSNAPAEIKLKQEKQECEAIIRGFLKNLSGQIKSGTPVVIAAPAWLRNNGKYERLAIFTKNLDETLQMGYNVNNKTREGLLYYREGQVVARDIIILRKK